MRACPNPPPPFRFPLASLEPYSRPRAVLNHLRSLFWLCVATIVIKLGGLGAALIRTDALHDSWSRATNTCWVALLISNALFFWAVSLAVLRLAMVR